MSSSIDDDRLLLARHIAGVGVLQGVELRAALKWNMEQFAAAVYGAPIRWFEMTIDGWDLTESGWDGLVNSLHGHPASVGPHPDDGRRN